MFLIIMLLVLVPSSLIGIVVNLGLKLLDQKIFISHLICHYRDKVILTISNFRWFGAVRREEPTCKCLL